MKTAPLKLLVVILALAGLGACASPASPGATSGGTRLDDSSKSMWATGPWANDHHFIAPPR